MAKNTHNRIDPSKINEYIFRPNNDKSQTKAEENADVMVYTIKGKEDYTDSEGFPLLADTIHQSTTGKTRTLKAETLPEAYAKKVFNGNRYRYYVKISNFGNFYDPNGLYSEWTQNKKAKGEYVWKFREVNPKTFSMYISFLKTNNKAWVINAERQNR